MDETTPELDALRRAGAEYQACRTSLETARAHLHPLVIAAIRADVPQHVVVRLSGYTRDRVRVLAREAGIEGHGRGRPPGARSGRRSAATAPAPHADRASPSEPSSHP